MTCKPSVSLASSVGTLQAYHILSKIRITSNKSIYKKSSSPGFVTRDEEMVTKPGLLYMNTGIELGSSIQ